MIIERIEYAVLSDEIVPKHKVYSVLSKPDWWNLEDT